MKRLLFNKGKFVPLAILLAILQSYLGYMRFKDLCINAHYNFKLYDFFNYMFIGDEFGQVCYLDKKNFELVLIPLTIIIFGMFITAYNFMSKPNDYCQFVYSRVNNESKFVRKLFWDDLDQIVFYVMSYYITIIAFGFINVSRGIELREIIVALLGNFIAKLALFVLLKSITLYMYLRIGFVKTLLYGIGIVVVIFMINVCMCDTPFDVILLSRHPNIAGVIVMVLMTVVICKGNRKIDLLKCNS